MTLSISEFCIEHRACSEGREWALANCTGMHDAWDKLPSNWLIWVATRSGILTSKERREFSRWCHTGDPFGVDGVNASAELLRQQAEVGERFRRGEASPKEYDAACAAVWAAIWDAQAEYLRKHTTPNFEN